MLCTEQVKPFCLYLIQDCETRKQIQTQGYSHLCLDGKLPLFPNIMSTGSGKDRILLGSTELSRVQLDQMDVKTVVVIAETAVDVDQFKGLSVHRIPLVDYETHCSQGDHKIAYTQVSKKV